MGVEAFAEAALTLLPGWRVEAIENVDFLAPFKFYRKEPRTLTIRTLFHPDGDHVLLADCRLVGSRQLPNQTEPQITTHFTGRVRLSKKIAQAQNALAISTPTGPAIEANDIYRLYFHGPAYQVLKRAWSEGDRVVGLMNPNLPDNHVPSNQLTTMSPRLIELCFQTAGLWEMAFQGRMGLPRHIDRVMLLRRPETARGPLYATVSSRPENQTFDADVVDTEGNHYLHLSGYQTIALPERVNSESLKALQAAIGPQPVAA
jgi:hypothetical protein